VESPDDTSHHGVRLQGSQREVVTASSLAFDIPFSWLRLSDAAKMPRGLRSLSGKDRQRLSRIDHGALAQWIAGRGGSACRHLLSEQHGNCISFFAQLDPFHLIYKDTRWVEATKASNAFPRSRLGEKLDPRSAIYLRAYLRRCACLPRPLFFVFTLLLYVVRRKSLS
jgi:hypothetical protein